MSQSHILTSVDNHVLTIQMQRFAQKNALSLEMYSQLTQAFIDADNNDDIKAIVIQGDKDCFCAGNDLNDFLNSGELDDAHPTVRFLKQLNNIKTPTIAAVSGPAVGIGTTMLLHFDMVFATESAVFKLPFCQLGLCPEAGSSLLLGNLAGHVKAFELLVLGDKFDAHQAKEIGIINHIVDANDVLTAARSAANKIAQLPVDAVSASRQLIKGANRHQVEQAITDELTEFSRLLKSEQCQNIIGQFFKK